MVKTGWKSISVFNKNLFNTFLIQCKHCLIYIFSMRKTTKLIVIYITSVYIIVSFLF
jgi:hypothetical protein